MVFLQKKFSRPETATQGHQTNSLNPEPNPIQLERWPHGPLQSQQTVEKDFSGTDAALWAEIKSAQELAASGKIAEAEKIYQELLATVSSSSPLKSLLIIGEAQANEALGHYPAALSGYQELKGIDGYQEIGFSGLARIYEIQGEPDKALDAYKQQLAFLEGKGTIGQTALIEERMTRLKARK